MAINRNLTILDKIYEGKILNVEPGQGGGGFRAISNAGESGLQEVPHLHVHILGGRNLGPMVSKSQ